MLADRALKIARDISADYNRFKILKLLQTAVAAGQNRGNNNYSNLAQQVLDASSAIIQNSTFNNYPPDLYDWLQTTGFGQLIPIRLAKKLIAGFTGDAANHLTANETASILEAANLLLSRLLKKPPSQGVSMWTLPEPRRRSASMRFDGG